MNVFRRGSTRIACYGNAVQVHIYILDILVFEYTTPLATQYEWRSTGVCTNTLLSSTADTLSLYLESGGSSDCLQVGNEKITQTSDPKLLLKFCPYQLQVWFVIMFICL